MDVTAKLKNLRIAPRKVRLVADLVRGESVNAVLDDLEFRTKRAAKPLRKLIQSAVANAENTFKLKKDDLFVKYIRVDDAVTMKRYMPRAFGRATVLRKRGSHITVTLASRKDDSSMVSTPAQIKSSVKKSVKKEGSSDIKPTTK